MHVWRSDDLPVTRWPNGAGRKADLVTGDGWMIGFAWLDADAPFSRLPGLDRTITLVEGPGFVLEVEGRKLSVATPFTPTGFDGGAVTQCRVAGPARVLNAMTDRSRFRHAVTILDCSAPIDPAGQVACVAVVLEGAASVGTDLPLARLDAVRFAQPGALVLSSGSRAAMITISSLA